MKSRKKRGSRSTELECIVARFEDLSMMMGDNLTMDKDETPDHRQKLLANMNKKLEAIYKGLLGELLRQQREGRVGGVLKAPKGTLLRAHNTFATFGSLIEVEETANIVGDELRSYRKAVKTASATGRDRENLIKCLGKIVVMNQKILAEQNYLRLVDLQDEMWRKDPKVFEL